MNQKELKEKLKYIPEAKYIYQRHDGKINKYIDTGDYYISCETGMSCASGSCLLGKVEDNLVELVEAGDYVNGQEVIEVRKQDGKIYLMTGYVPQIYIKEEIKTIVTHEQFRSIEYKV